MAELNPLIPLSGRPFEIGNALLEGRASADLHAQSNQNIERSKQSVLESQARVSAGANAEQRAQSEEARRAEDFNLKSIASRLLPMKSTFEQALKTGDARPVISALTSSAEAIEKRGGDSRHTRGMIELAKNGKLKELTAAGRSTIQEAFSRGLITAQKSDDYGTVISAVDPEGNPAFYRPNKTTGEIEKIEGFTPPPKSALATVTAPDGTQITLGGPHKAGANTKDVEKEQLALSENLDEISRIRESFKPEYHQLSSRFDSTITSGKAFLGLDVSEEEKNKYQDFAQYKADVAKMQTGVIKNISGSAVSQQEGERIGGFLVNAGTGLFDGDDPIAAERKIQRFDEAIQLAMARRNWLLYHEKAVSTAAFNKFPIESMKEIISSHRDETIKRMSAEHPDRTGREINDMALAQARIVFGL